MTDLTVVTLNTWKGEGAYEARLRAMAEGLAALQPDLVLLQEVFAAPDLGLHTGTALAGHLGLAHVFAPARRKPRSFAGRPVDSWSGLSVLWRGGISRSEVVDLPADAADGERIAQVVTLDTADGRLLAVNAHLTHLAGADALRRQQLETILAHVEPRMGDAAVVLGGDFNAGPGSPPLRWLAERPGLSVTRAGPVVPTLAGSHRCIDYLFLVQADGRPRYRAHSGRRVLSQPDAAGVLASDHCGVCARLAPADAAAERHVRTRREPGAGTVTDALVT